MPTSREPKNGGITFERSQTLATSRDKSFLMPRGMSFELPLSREMPETVTGVGHKYHSYEVQSIMVHRNSHLDVVSAHPIRLHRLPRSIQGDLLDQVSAPPNPFRSELSVRVEFHALRTDFSPGKITLQVLETHLLKITPMASESITHNSVLSTITRKGHAIVRETYENSKNTTTQSFDLLDSEWTTTALVHLPQSFQACTQNLQSEVIQVHHKLKFAVEFAAERAQRKKTVGGIPFQIYMSPYTVMEHDLVYRQTTSKSWRLVLRSRHPLT
ncbi:hypothetical protein BO82DRAFT_426920 [Aspergillus uvarum CBS 121591]|uniref:Arrestin-like N-terminal domain-containing protein n=1 Tax=Aspergillus uvarum CBS 121591 TaxID=1448315 RepID=A0A319D883_9EURO|nr:hypothetical protein BO82DRAFT_426920 [Aspergillus uvarum CBS 121591]PYH76162.1 hypothetical protein BO82DRAFT_426920 [Aspergillus uvarum CBS 121591]